MILLDQGGRAREWSEIRPPGPALAPFIEFFWLQSPPSKVPAAGWRVVPDASAHVLAKRLVGAGGGGGPRTLVSVVGARSVYRDIDASGRSFTLGARLRPGALGALFSTGAGPLTDRSLPLEDVAGPAAVDLRDRLAGAPDPADALVELVSWCAALARTARPVEPRAEALGRLAELCHGRMTVARMAREVGISPRRLRALSRDEIGLAPKRVARIARCHEALRRGTRKPSDWSRIAIGCGFHDEAHLIHDARDLLGTTPRRFITRSDDRFLQFAEAGPT